MSLPRIAVFLAVICSLTAGIHYYLWARLVRDLALPAPWPTLGAVLFALLGLLLPLGMMLGRVLSRDAVTPIAWAAFTWMGLMFFLFVLLVGVDLAQFLTWIVRRGASLPPLDPERRTLLARVLGGSVAVSALAVTGFGLVNVLRPVAVERVRVLLRKLPSELSGYRIVQVSDIHVGPTIGREFIVSMVDRINALNPDLVAITGDLVDGRVAELGHLVEPLRNLRARDGVYFVTGNHEYYSGPDEWIEFVKSLGIKVLRNERVAIRGADGFDLAGVDDWSAKQFGHGHGADMPKALAGRDPSRAVVLLAHQPKHIAQASELGVDLQLSGHTHGGQMVPFNFLIPIDQPYVAGLHRRGDTAIYVSRGTGYWGPPVRVGAPAEITSLELVSG